MEEKEQRNCQCGFFLCGIVFYLFPSVLVVHQAMTCFMPPYSWLFGVNENVLFLVFVRAPLPAIPCSSRCAVMYVLYQSPSSQVREGPNRLLRRAPWPRAPPPPSPVVSCDRRRPQHCRRTWTGAAQLFLTASDTCTASHLGKPPLFWLLYYYCSYSKRKIL
jgi:hypothetical protein